MTETPTLSTRHLTYFKPHFLEALDTMQQRMMKDEDTSENVINAIKNLHTNLQRRLPQLTTPVTAQSMLDSLTNASMLQTSECNGQERHNINLAVKVAFDEAATKTLNEAKSHPRKRASMLGVDHDTLGMTQSKERII